MMPSFSALSPKDLWFIAEGALGTLYLTAASVLFGTALALIAGVGRASRRWWIVRPLGFLADLLRSVPVIIQLILFNSLVALAGYGSSPFISGVVILSLYMGAYGGEIIRGGIEAVPVPTRRAARSLGMNGWQDLCFIVLPIGARVALPSWAGLVGGLVKDTALTAVIGYVELLRSAQIVINRTQEPLLVLAGVGLAYFVICYPIAKWTEQVEAGRST